MYFSFHHSALVTGFLVVAFTAHAKTASEVYEQAAKSTVVVENINAKEKAQSMGSGVVLADGDVVTNCHVIKDASRIKVRSGSKEYTATLRYSDEDRDVCSLSVLGLNSPTVVVGSTKTLKVGAKVYAVGAPKGLKLTLSDGIVSSLREVEGGHYIQTTAAISPGSSGGGLFDENGALVGLTTFYLAEGQNLNFAVPIEWVKELAKRSSRAPEVKQLVTQWINKSIELESSQDWPAFLEHSRRWTKTQPANFMAWLSLGNALKKTNQSANAIEAFQQAIRIDPENSSAWLNLGSAYDKNNQQVKAIEAYQQALRIDPADSHAWFNLGLSQRKANQLVKSIEAYQQALRIDPEFANAWYGLGQTFTKANQSADAIEAYQQAIRIDPEKSDAWHNLGNVYASVGQSSKAIDIYQRALRVNPKVATTWQALSLAYAKDRQYANAIEASQQAVRINPEYVDAWKVLGVSYSLLGERGKVVEVYKRLKTLDPEYAEQFFQLNVIR